MEDQENDGYSSIVKSPMDPDTARIMVTPQRDLGGSDSLRGWMEKMIKTQGYPESH